MQGAHRRLQLQNWKMSGEVIRDQGSGSHCPGSHPPTGLCLEGNAEVGLSVWLISGTQVLPGLPLETIQQNLAGLCSGWGRWCVHWSAPGMSVALPQGTKETQNSATKPRDGLCHFFFCLIKV